MATYLDRLLASIERILCEDYATGEVSSEHTREYLCDFGTAMAIVRRDGTIRELGGSRWVVHRYDGKGKLLSRTRRMHMLDYGEHVAYGELEVIVAMRKLGLAKQPRSVEADIYT